MRRYTESEFDQLSWHDDHVYGFDLELGDPERDDWTSDLVLDLDHIVEWVRGEDRMRFRVAPASLVFHGVTDLRIALAWEDTGFRATPYLPSIDAIERRPVEDQKVFLDRPYYAWEIRFNGPRGGAIGFGAVGFTLALLREPTLCDEQQLTREQRKVGTP